MRRTANPQLIILAQFCAESKSSILHYHQVQGMQPVNVPLAMMLDLLVATCVLLFCKRPNENVCDDNNDDDDDHSV